MAMAFNCSSSAAKHLALVVFIFGLLSQYQLEARSTQFFSKVTAPSNFNDSTTESNANAAKEQIPQQDSSENGYGLVPSDASDTTKTNNENYNYMAEQTSELDGTTDQGYPTTYNDKAYVTKPQGYQPNNNYGSYEKEQQEDQELGATSLLDQDAGHSTTYNNNDSGLNTYNSQQQEFSQEEKDAVLSYNSNNNNNNYNYNGDQESYNTNVNNNNNNYNYNGDQESYNTNVNSNNNYNYNGEQEGYNNNVQNNNNFRYNGKQEGMSDTRFLENGRYHYNFKGYSGNTNNYNNNNNNNNNNANYNNNNYQVDAENEGFDAFNP